MKCGMKRFTTFLDWLNHNDRPAEAQSPVQASVVAALVSFIAICWLDGRAVSLLGVWWAELLAYAFVPVVLAFIILYRSSWHQQESDVARALRAGFWSFIIFFGVVIGIGVAMVLVSLLYYAYGGLSRFHY